MERLREITSEGTIHEALGIRVLEAAPDRVDLEMEVGPRVHQAMGLLHGGASAVLAESAASIGAYLNIDPAREYTVGTDLNISHLRARSKGFVRATATPIRKGRSIHVWNIDIRDEKGELVAVSRCTLAVRPWPKQPKET
jgi:1,4-dihydroxy-2-naphthoyl-CoA hydrolase